MNIPTSTPYIGVSYEFYYNMITGSSLTVQITGLKP
jgi:hypothetical protein